MILIKTPEEIALMREGGRHHAEVLAKLRDMVRPGITTAELDAKAEELVLAYGDIPAFKGYRPKGVIKPYPATLCTSVNNVVVHGIPSKDEVLREGDVVSLDLGICHKGVYTDAAITVPVGDVSDEIKALIKAGEESLRLAIAQVKPGNTVGDIGHAVESYIGKQFGIVRGFSGHGVGREIHEDPYVPNYGKPGTGDVLVSGMTIAIEPMLTLGKHQVEILADEYTVITKDDSVSVHVEHTVLVTEDGVEVLTG
jgi:methionyl aminopeptidase